MFVGSFPRKILITCACFEHEVTIKVAIIGLCEHHTSFAHNACKLCTRVCASYERALRVKTCKRHARTSSEKRGDAQHECRVFPSNLLYVYIHVHTCTYVLVCIQSADSTVSFFVDSSAQQRGMRPNLIAMKNKNSQSQI